MTLCQIECIVKDPIFLLAHMHKVKCRNSVFKQVKNKNLVDLNENLVDLTMELKYDLHPLINHLINF